MVGKAICRQFNKKKDIKIITRSHSELDLCNQENVKSFMASERPDEIIIAAAKVGGIYANNTYPADFIYENIPPNISKTVDLNKDIFGQYVINLFDCIDDNAYMEALRLLP